MTWESALCQLNQSVQKQFCSGWTLRPNAPSSNPNFYQSDTQRSEVIFNAVLDECPDEDDLKRSGLHVNSFKPQIEVIKSDSLVFKVGDTVVNNTTSKNYKIVSIEDADRNTWVMKLNVIGG